jgi:hypothetical protein
MAAIRQARLRASPTWRIRSPARISASSFRGSAPYYPPNLTPDEDTGLGKWSEADIVTAIRTGIRPDGRELAPIMAWRSYGALTDADAAALAAYLKSLTPVAHKAPGPFGEGEKPTHPYMTVATPQ